MTRPRFSDKSWNMPVTSTFFLNDIKKDRYYHNLLLVWYFTQLTVTLLHCSKVLEKFKSLSSGLCTIFCK